MRRITKLKLAAMLIFTGLIIGSSSCKKDEGESSINLQFNFEHKVGTETCVYDTIKYTNEAGNVYSVVTLRYFISDITLHRSDGSKLVIDEEHYVDISDNATLSFIPAAEVDNDIYTSISFVFGLDSLKNTTGRYLNPPESNMEWPVPMGGGYHYMKLEGKYDSSGVTKNYKVHTGALMGMPHHINIALANSSINADREDITITLEMDINEWFESPNTYDFDTYGAAIMGNMNAQMVIRSNGGDVFSVGSIK